MKTKLFLDLDNTLVDFQSGIDKIPESIAKKYWKSEKGKIEYDNIPGIFGLMDPLPGAIEAVKMLKDDYDIYILSTAPWGNPSSWSDKLEWVKRYFDDVSGTDEDNKDKNQFYKRLILTHHKDLLFHGDEYLIDDRPNNGASNFGDHWIKFGPEGENVINNLSPEDKRKCWHKAIADLKDRVKTIG